MNYFLYHQLQQHLLDHLVLALKNNFLSRMDLRDYQLVNERTKLLMYGYIKKSEETGSGDFYAYEKLSQKQGKR